MEPLQFDGYTSYSDASTPRTPSPRTSLSTDDMHHPYNNSPSHFKPSMELEPVRNIFADHPTDDTAIIPEPHIHSVHQSWQQPHHQLQSHFPPSRGSLLQELYDDHHVRHNDVPHLDHHDRSYTNWYNNNISCNATPELTQVHHRNDSSMMRRNTFPYVRQDREEIYPTVNGDHDGIHGTYYADSVSAHGSPLSLAPDSHLNRSDGFHAMSGSPAPSYRDFERQESSAVKLEDHSPVIVPTQSAYVNSQTATQMPLAGYMSPHGIPIQHTDDAASKETQYLRRRCFNCHTTEPPSWRRSTLTPGKIVCNKCGLYERTHLRARPLRFDELRAGNKTRKQNKTTASPKVSKVVSPGSPHIVKKEPNDAEPMTRRISSNASVHSNRGGSSDWDDNVSMYSSGSTPHSGFSSPAVGPYAISPDPNSQSPPLNGREASGIRLPSAPLSDIASLQSQTARKAVTSPYFQPTSLPGSIHGPMFPRRPSDSDDGRRVMDIPEVTGWQTIPLDLGPQAKVVRKNSTPVRKAVAA